MKFLVDTNVISELRKPVERRNPGVVAWYSDVGADGLFLSVLVVGEIRKGIERKRTHDPAQANALETWLGEIVGSFADRILPISVSVASRWGAAQRIRNYPVIDGLLAATAQEHGMQLVTRNVADLADWPATDLLINPFS